MKQQHIVWDWNGTLFHDIDAVVAATNEVFKPYGIGPYDAEGFRAAYTRPIWRFYERLLGRSLHEGEWERLDQGFHEHYHRLMPSCELTPGALDCLTGWTGTQSLLSMWMHDRLVSKVAELGIDRHFTRVDGLRRFPGGGPKAEHMVAHLRALGVDPETVVVIGDSVDDAHAARYVGARAILYTGGMSHRSELEAQGVPVVDTLADALDYI